MMKMEAKADILLEKLSRLIKLRSHNKQLSSILYSFRGMTREILKPILTAKVKNKLTIAERIPLYIRLKDGPSAGKTLVFVSEPYRKNIRIRVVAEKDDPYLLILENVNEIIYQLRKKRTIMEQRNVRFLETKITMIEAILDTLTKLSKSIENHRNSQISMKGFKVIDLGDLDSI